MVWTVQSLYRDNKLQRLPVPSHSPEHKPNAGWNRAGSQGVLSTDSASADYPQHSLVHAPAREKLYNYSRLLECICLKQTE